VELQLCLLRMDTRTVTIPTNNTSCIQIRTHATLCAVPKIAVTFSDKELAQVKRDAGLVPLSAWIRNCTVGKSQPESEKGNGSASHQDLSVVPESSVSGRRTGASERRSARRGKNRVRAIADIANASIRKTGRTSKRTDASLERPDGIESDSIISIIVTRENFAEVMATIPPDEVDRWARSLPPEVLPSHTASSHRHTCMCQTCSHWRKVNDIPYGGPGEKKKSRFAK
jgi:hypothetical protein